MAEERLQKILAAAGIASRRKAEDLIVAGRVSVNGKTVVELGSKADLAVDEVKVDGQRLSAPKHFVYFALHKPKNCVTTVFDPEGRETVMKFFRNIKERIYPVGRLDYASEGLLLLTNDGDFAAKLMSPASHVSKTYLVKIKGLLTPEQEEQFRTGIPMHGRRTAPAGLRILKKTQNPWYEVRLIEGRQNQIRVMFKHFGHLVEKLKRIRIGFLDLGALKAGVYRTLTNTEVEKLKKLLDTPPEARPESYPKPAKRSASGFTERATGYNEKRWAAERKAAFGGMPERKPEPERKTEGDTNAPPHKGARPFVKREHPAEQRPQAKPTLDRPRRLEPRASYSPGEQPRKFSPKPFSKPFSKSGPGGKPHGNEPRDGRRGEEHGSSSGEAPPRRFSSKPFAPKTFSPKPYAKSGPGGRPPAGRPSEGGPDRSAGGSPPRKFASKPFSPRPFSKSGPAGKPSGPRSDSEGRGPSSEGPPPGKFSPKPFSPKPFAKSRPSGNPGSIRSGSGRPGGEGRSSSSRPSSGGPPARKFSPKPFSRSGPDRKPRGDRGRGPNRGGGR
jgi:23S rRNA pseudouridine2605 synthase